MMHETKGLIGDQVEAAYRYWQQGLSTFEIAEKLKLPEHLIANNLKAIKHYEPSKNEAVA